MITLNEKFLTRMQNILRDDFPTFLSSFNNPEQKGIFVNSKISLDRFKEIVNFKIEPIAYENRGFYIENIKLGKHPLHHAGAFYVQDPSAMFTANSISLAGNENVLDMCAAPGGKSIQIANKLTSGTLVCNEIVKSRAQILYSNIERMGINAIITNETPKNLAKAYSNCFDVVFVDAPCSGEGMFRRGDEYVKEWNENLPAMCAKRQLEILNEADKCLKIGGILVYSTCTYEICENEAVVKEFLNSHNYQLQNINYPFSRGIDMAEAVRLYPHQVRGEGQFVAVLKKNGGNFEFFAKNLALKENSLCKSFLKQNTNLDINCYQYDNTIYNIKNINLIKQNVNYISLGVLLGEAEGKIFKPNHYLFSAFGKNFNKKLEFNNNSADVARYIHGETLTTDLSDGYGAIIVNGCPLGGFKISAGKFKNLYPKGLRN